MKISRLYGMLSSQLSIMFSMVWAGHSRCVPGIFYEKLKYGSMRKIAIAVGIPFSHMY
jgi:hypothetical protein